MIPPTSLTVNAKVLNPPLIQIICGQGKINQDKAAPPSTAPPLNQIIGLVITDALSDTRYKLPKLKSPDNE